MISFASDYTTGAHEAILKRLLETNREPFAGYGMDTYSLSAQAKIKEACQTPEAEVFFLVGGTQTNMVVITTMLAAYEGVIAAESGHINVHEAGAVEYTGHKVLALPSHDGKIAPKELEAYVKRFYADGNHEHMVYPGMVYISYPTESGTLYTRAELEAIYSTCREYRMPLFVDGARLGYGLASPACDLTLPELASLCDVFYIGGTKVGALCGEAVVFTHGNAPKGFYTMTKQHGAMLAKGKLLGIQFDTLFTDDLYFEIGRHGMEMAQKLKAVLTKYGLPFLSESPTNQQFVIVDNDLMEKLAQKVVFSFWDTIDESHTAIRFATSWSTTDEDIRGLDQALAEVLQQ